MKAKSQLTYILLVFSAFAVFGQNPNEINESSTLVELLQNGESYSIEITSIGCFGGSKQTLKISKEGNIIFARLEENMKQLTETEIQTFINFEHELRALQIGGCTTVDTYVLRYQGEIFRTSDGTCSWHGYRKLINIFV